MNCHICKSNKYLSDSFQYDELFMISNNEWQKTGNTLTVFWCEPCLLEITIEQANCNNCNSLENVILDEPIVVYDKDPNDKYRFIFDSIKYLCKSCLINLELLGLDIVMIKKGK